MGRTTLITHPVSEQTKRFGSQYNRQVWTFVWGLLDNFAIALIEESPPKVRCADSSAIRLILISDSIRFSSVFDFREMGNSKKTHATFSGVIFQSQDFRTLVSIHYILSMAHIINILLCHLARVLHSSVRILLTWQHAYRTHSQSTPIYIHSWFQPASCHLLLLTWGLLCMSTSSGDANWHTGVLRFCITAKGEEHVSQILCKENMPKKKKRKKEANQRNTK